MDPFVKKYQRKLQLEVTDKLIIYPIVRKVGETDPEEEGEYSGWIMPQNLRKQLLDAAIAKWRLQKIDPDSLREQNLIYDVYNVLDEFLSDFRRLGSTDYEVLFECLRNIDTALAKLLVNNVVFEEINEGNEEDGEEYLDDQRPFHDEESCYVWLQSFDDNDFSYLIFRQLGIEANLLLIARKYLALQLSSMEAEAEFFIDNASIPKIEFPSKLDKFQQRLIYALCDVWLKNVDKGLGTARTGEGIANPLLRFLEAGVELGLGEKRPNRKQIENLLKKYVKPDLRREQIRREERSLFETEPPTGIDDWPDDLSP